MAVEGGSRLFSWFGFVPESTDSPVETAGTTRSPGLCLPPWGYAESSEAPGGGGAGAGRGQGQGPLADFWLWAPPCIQNPSAFTSTW